MSITVSDARVESLALRRLLVGELPGCQYPVQYLRLLSRLCVLVVSSLCPRRVFKVSPHVVATSPSFSHSLSTLRQSRPECNSSFLTVSSMNHECAITVLPDHRQNFTPVLSPLHRSIIQTTKHIATPVSESPPRAAEALPRHHQPVVSVSRIPRLLSVIHSISVHYPATVTLSLLSAMSPVHLQCLARACWAYPQFTTSVFSNTMSARLSSRQYVTDSSLKPPLDLGILSNLAKTLSEHCQSTVRALSEYCQSTVRVLPEHCQSTPRESSTPSHVSPSRPQRVLSSHSRRVVKSSPRHSPSILQSCHRLVLALPPCPVRDDVLPSSSLSSSKRLQISLQTAPEAPRIPSSRSALVSLTLKAISPSSSIPSRLFILVSLLQSSHFKSSHR